MGEQTFFIIKPDAIKHGVVGQIFSRVERRGFVICDLNMMKATKDLVTRYYEHLTDKPFVPLLVDYMTSGPIIVGILEGQEVNKYCQDMEGIVANVVNGSDSAEAAEREIGLWLGK
ncbi:TPA: nucleoside-diphosphate kinase [Streptococcus suis]|nr:nucleoside-diphosphate kinase [Streptococcus suis]